MKNLILFFIIFLTTFGAISQNESSYKITVKVNNIKNTKGQVVVGLYNTKESFLSTPFKGEMVKIEGNTLTIEFNGIEKGIYAISLFHDENSNNKIDTNFMGIPKESFASSNNAKGFMGPPKWEDAKFEVAKNLSLEISF